MQLPQASVAGGRPRRFCSERCRSAWRRYVARVHRGRHGSYEQWEAAAEHRHQVATAAYEVASAARHLAAALAAESDDPPTPLDTWRQPQRPPRLSDQSAGHTQAAAAVLAAAQKLAAAAVAADRAAGHSWEAIGRVLGVSADTAARRYRPRAGP
ncbi:hypothetical protein [Streptomyces alboflavus]|uniref:hypothetical protein n=1 Tax=Streptomyces alboflavus TaxID=67267 RepID=UPI000F656BD3|nr:hypothetical protein [Streptomyces alboflavus]